MSTKYIASNWRLPNQENSSKSDNYGLTFDGSSEYIDTTLDIDANSDFSISFWFKISDFSSFARFLGTYSGTVPTSVGAFTSSMTSNIGRTPTTNLIEPLLII